MQIERLVAHAPRTTDVGRDLAGITGPCIGCSGCQGICLSLIEMLSIPETILKRGRRP